MNISVLLQRMTANPRLWRAFLAAIFLIPLILVLPHLRSLVVRNAVVTAYIKDVRSPIAGDVGAIVLQPGDVSQAGQIVMSINNPRLNRSSIARLEITVEAAEQQFIKLQESLSRVQSLSDAREADLAAYADATQQALEIEWDILTDRMSASEAKLKAAESTLRRSVKLHKDDLLSNADLELSESDYYGALADLSQNQLDIDRLEQQLREIKRGVFLNTIPDGALQAQNQVQALELELLKLNKGLRMAEAEYRATMAEFTEARRAFQHMENAGIELPPNMTIWEVLVASGAHVVEGGHVLSYVDCSDLMVDIAVDDATLELLQPGQGVRIRLFGSFHYTTGKIYQIRGSAGLKDMNALAAKVLDRAPRDGRVLAKLDASPLASHPQKSCDIGRTTYAEFDGIGLLETILYPLFR